eukprot:gene5734-8774_t
MCPSALEMFLSIRGLSRVHAVRLNGWYTGAKGHCKGDAEASALLRLLVSGLQDEGGAFPLVHRWLHTFVKGGRAQAPHAGQAGCPDVVEGLRAHPFWDPSDIGVSPEEIAGAKAATEQELLSRKGRIEGFQPYRNPTEQARASAGEDSLGVKATTAGHWNVSYVELHGAESAAGADWSSLLSEGVQGSPRPRLFKHRLARPFGHTLVSCLAPHSDIVPHRGPTNKKLRLYIPVAGCSGDCGLVVNGETRVLQDGAPEAIVFDDSFLHHAYNRSGTSRFVLITDFWHPDFTPQEVALLSLMHAAFERQLQHPSAPASGNPYRTIAE